MSRNELILDFGDEIQGFLFKNSCYSQNCTSPKLYKKLHFWAEFGKNEENGHQSRK